MTVITVANTNEIAASPETVWHHSTSIENWPDWLPTVSEARRLTGGPFDVGSRFELKQPFQRRAVWEVVTCIPGKSFTWRKASGREELSAGHDIVRTEHGTLSRLEIVHSRPIPWPAALVVRAAFRIALRRENAALKARCENRHDPGANDPFSGPEPTPAPKTMETRGVSSMIDTEITRRFGLRTPILNAGMAMVARPDLAAAVSNAGGLGMIGADVAPAEALRAMVRAVKAKTDRPFGVDLLAPMITDAHLDVLAEEGVALCVVFWGNPTRDQVARIKAGGTAFWMQVGSVEEALDAKALGAEAIIVQGLEGGGHNRSVATTFNLLPAVRAAVAPLPVIAAGGITDGASMAAALALGAEAVWCGTRFLASAEADANDGYKARVLEASVGDTLSTTLFGPEMPLQPMRVIRNAATDEWAGREEEAMATTAGQTAGTLRTPDGAVPLPRFSVYLPTRDVDGDLDQLCLTAGQSAGKIRALKPAAQIVDEMTREAHETIAALARRATGSATVMAALHHAPVETTTA